MDGEHEPKRYRVETWMLNGQPRQVRIWPRAAWLAQPRAESQDSALYFRGLGYLVIRPVSPPEPA